MEEEAQKAGAEGTPAANEGAGEQKPVRVRPKFNPMAIALNVGIPPAVCAGIGIGVYFIWHSALWSWLAPLLLLLLYIVIRLRDIAIFAVHVYQRVAPDHIRDACVFTPTCSEYMILALKKYGFIRGVIKGIGRLKRCHYPNEGEDYP